MKTRKVISAILAGACAISALSISATAADKTVKAVGGTSFTVKASVASPEINVSLPSAVATVINPYGVPVTVKGEVYGDSGVASPLYTVRNFTVGNKIKVNATATVTAKSAGITINSTESDITTTSGSAITGAASKTVAAWVIGAVDSNTVALYDTSMPSDTAASAKKNYLYKNETAKLITSTAYPSSGANTVIFNEPKAETIKDGVGQGDGIPANSDTIMVIPAAEQADPSAKEVDKYGYGQFQVGGLVTKDANWDTKNDSVTFSLVLNVSPTSDSVG